MSPWQRIVYISKASFAGADRATTVEPEIGRILMQSRRNNPARGLVGALYYGDGHFFQVLEGEAGSIDALLDALRKDPRHHDLTVLSRRPIEQASFTGWSMKYVAAADEVRRLLASFGHRHFDPYRFDSTQVAAMVGLLQHRPSTAEAPAGGATPSAGDVSFDGGRDGARLARRAFGVAVAALLFSLLAIVLAWRR